MACFPSCFRNAILKVINTVRLSLNRSKDRPFEVETINHVSQTLQRQLKHIVGRKHDFDTQEKRNCKMVGASTILLIQRLLDENLCQANLRDNNAQELYSVLSTPETAQGRSKHHSLLTQFRYVYRGSFPSCLYKPLSICPVSTAEKNWFWPV